VGRYVIKANGFVEDDLEFYDLDPRRTPELFVSEHLPTPIGVLTAQGEMVYKSPRPIGFGRMNEW
jgi:hypothetical protein